MRTSLIGLSAMLAILPAQPLFAQEAEQPAAAEEEPAAEEETPPITVSAGITAVTDYRFRGVSLSGLEPAIQPTINVTHESGFYGGTWASNLVESELYGEYEIDLYLGWSGEVTSGTTFNGGVIYYWYPDGSGDNDYFEPYASLSRDLGPFNATVGGAWAPSQDATGNEDWYYYYGSLGFGIPDTPVTLTGRLGNQDFGSFSYVEWSLSASVNEGPFTITLEYVDTDQRTVTLDNDASAGLVFSVGLSF